MNWKGIANWALSGVVAFAAGFFSVPFVVDGATWKQQLAFGAATGFVAMANHLRQNPLKWVQDDPR